LAPARGDVVDRFREYVLGVWRARGGDFPGVRGAIVAYVLRDAHEQRFCFDFTRAGDAVFQRGEPPACDMRYTYAAARLQHALDGAMDWDELDFAADTTIYQRRHLRDLQRLLRSATDNPVHASPRDACVTTGA